MGFEGVLFYYKVSFLAASCFIVSLKSLRISAKTWFYLFLSESDNFENSWLCRFQSDLISIGRTENFF